MGDEWSELETSLRQADRKFQSSWKWPLAVCSLILLGHWIWTGRAALNLWDGVMLVLLSIAWPLFKQSESLFYGLRSLGQRVEGIQRRIGKVDNQVEEMEVLMRGLENVPETIGQRLDALEIDLDKAKGRIGVVDNQVDGMRVLMRGLENVPETIGQRLDALEMGSDVPKRRVGPRLDEIGSGLDELRGQIDDLKERIDDLEERLQLLGGYPDPLADI